MNPVFHQAGETAQLGWVMGLMTLVFLTTFVAWAWWAWAPSRREQMDEAARLPLDDEEGA